MVLKKRKNLEQISAENWAENWIQVFEEVGIFLGALCGIVVLYSEDERAFVESSSFGYGDEGFFYEFLKSDGTEFTRLAISPEPIIYRVEKKNYAFNEKTKSIFVQRIYPSEMRGFILLEFPFEDIPTKIKFLLSAVLEKITRDLFGDERALQEENSEEKYSKEHFIAQTILKLASNWDEDMSRSKLKKNLYLISEKGKVRNKVIKYIHNLLQGDGELLFINYLPEQVGKFEKSLREWLQIASNGTLVIERASEIEPSHQRIFLENIGKNTENVFFLFWDEASEIKNPYLPFQKLLQENLIKIQRFSSVESEKRLFILEGLFKEVCKLSNRKKMHISKEALEFLDKTARESELGEIEGVLEIAVLRCRDFNLSREELEKTWNERATLPALLDLEELDLRKSVEALEKHKILLAHRLFSGNQLRMAKALGISRGSLQYKMKQMGI